MNERDARSALLIYTSKNISSFINSDFFYKINKFQKVDLIQLNLKEKKREEIDSESLTLEPISKPIQKLSVFIRCLELWANRNISYAHKVRAFNQFGAKRERDLWLSVVTYNLHNWGMLKRYLVRFLARKPLINLLQFLEKLVRFFYIQKKWAPVLSNYTQVLIPYAGFVSYEFNNLVWVCRRLGIRTIALQENWDNVSSNLVITEAPDSFAVWGEQSKFHLVNIHGLEEKAIEVVGSPRFDKYYNSETLTPLAMSHETGKTDLTGKSFVVVIGTGDGIDDEELIDSTYLALNQIDTKIIVVYRPHPGSRFKVDLRLLREKHPRIVIDENDSSREYGHHIALVIHAKVVINHLSTLTLEGLIAKRFVCAPLFLGRKAEIRYNRIIESAPHYVGLRLIPNLLTPSTQSEFVEKLKYSVTHEPSDVTEIVQWICKKSEYAEAVAEIMH